MNDDEFSYPIISEEVDDDHIVWVVEQFLNYRNRYRKIAEPLTTEQIQQQYKEMVASLVRERYSVDDEFAILRKNMAGIDTTDFVTYNAYVEQCKAQVKAQLNLT